MFYRSKFASRSSIILVELSPCCFQSHSTKVAQRRAIKIGVSQSNQKIRPACARAFFAAFPISKKGKKPWERGWKKVDWGNRVRPWIDLALWRIDRSLIKLLNHSIIIKRYYYNRKKYYNQQKVLKSRKIVLYFKSRNFRGQKLSRFSRFWPFFAKVYAFGNSKAAKRESFFTRNHRFFQKRESFFKREKTLFSANLKAFHETYKNIAIEDVQVGLQLTRLKPIHAAWLVEFYNHMTTSKGKEIIDGGWKASGISDASKLGSQKLPYIDPFHEIDPMLGDNADQAADDNSHLLPVCDVTVEEFELLCGGKIQRELTDYETDDDSE